MGNANKILYQKPETSYNKYHTNLIWIKPLDKKSNEIPCMFLPSKNPTDKIILYFHANSEDIGYSPSFFEKLRSEMDCHILAVEYPTYGLYRYKYVKRARKRDRKDYLSDGALSQSKLDKFRVSSFSASKNLLRNLNRGGLRCSNDFKRERKELKNVEVEFDEDRVLSEEKIEQDAISVFEYLTKKLRIKPRSIIVLGRSLGSGPAIALASQKDVAALILIAPFKSISDVARDKLGSFLGYFVNQRFNNLEKIQYVESPILLMHGKKDKIVPFWHSIDLMKQAKFSKGIDIYLGEKMEHNKFNMMDDIVEPIRYFINKHCRRNHNGKDLIYSDSFFRLRKRWD